MPGTWGLGLDRTAAEIGYLCSRDTILLLSSVPFRKSHSTLGLHFPWWRLRWLSDALELSKVNLGKYINHTAILETIKVYPVCRAEPTWPNRAEGSVVCHPQEWLQSKSRIHLKDGYRRYSSFLSWCQHWNPTALSEDMIWWKLRTHKFPKPCWPLLIHYEIQSKDCIV